MTANSLIGRSWQGNGPALRFVLTSRTTRSGSLVDWVPGRALWSQLMHDRSALRRLRFFSRSVGRAAASRLRRHCRARLASAFGALVLAPLVFGAAAFAQPSTQDAPEVWGLEAGP